MKMSFVFIGMSPLGVTDILVLSTWGVGTPPWWEPSKRLLGLTFFNLPTNFFATNQPLFSIWVSIINCEIIILLLIIKYENIYLHFLKPCEHTLNCWRIHFTIPISLLMINFKHSGLTASIMILAQKLTSLTMTTQMVLSCYCWGTIPVPGLYGLPAPKMLKVKHTYNHRCSCVLSYKCGNH